MADMQRLAQALKNADAAGDTEAASRIAQAIRQMSPDNNQRIDQAFNAAGEVSNSQTTVSSRDVGLIEGGLNAVQDSGEVGDFIVSRGRSLASDISAAIDGIGNSLTLGTADEIEAGLSTGFGLLGDFDKTLQGVRGRQKVNEVRSPVARVAGDVAGSLALGSGLAKNGLLASSRLAPQAGLGARTGAAALDGAVAGAAFGAGDAESNRGQAAIQGGTIGAITGGVVGNTIGRIERSKVLKSAVPATQDIKAAASSLYKEAEQAGVAFNQNFYNRLTASAKRAVGRTHSGLHPKTQAALDVLENEKGRTLSLSEVDEIRQVINSSQSGADAADARLLGKIVNKLDDFVNSAKTTDITGNRDGIRVLGEARKLWQKQAKSQVVDDIIEKAQNQATGFENGLRVQFRSLANNPKRFRQFNKQEQAAIKKIVRGGAVENTLRAIGWLDPRGPFGALLTGGVGVGTGVAPAAALAGAGLVGKKAAETATRGNVGALQRVITNGNQAVALPPPSNSASITSQVLAPNIQANIPSQRR